MRICRDPAAVRGLMARPRTIQAFEIGAALALMRIREDFDAASVTEAETSAEISRMWKRSGYVLDPHSAVGVVAARAH